MPIMSPPNSQANVLVNVPAPVPMPTKQPAQPSQQQSQPQQSDDESLFVLIKSAPLMLLPHNQSQSKPQQVKASRTIGDLLRLRRSMARFAKGGEGTEQTEQGGDLIRFAYKAPAGGMISRGTFYPGGSILPDEATQSRPAPTKRMGSGEPASTPGNQLVSILQKLSGLSGLLRSKQKLSSF